MTARGRNRVFLFTATAVAGAAWFGVGFLGVPEIVKPTMYVSDTIQTEKEEREEVFVATHLATPENVKAVYMTSWVAGTDNTRKRLVQLIEDTELNSVVVDIKDYTGMISIPTDDAYISELDSVEIRIPDIREFIGQLHEKGIYVIGRVVVFQDPYFASKKPHLAVAKESDHSSTWKDYKGLSYVDPGASEMWSYVVAISNSAYATGFDEINFDYIRFPSDGNMRDIYYPLSEERVLSNPDGGKSEVIKEFFIYLDKHLGESDLKLSADLFGMTTTNTDDLNIGQILEYADPYFDFIAPMVYPSHYPPGFNGHTDPAAVPYEIVKFSLDSARERLIAATSSPTKVRPWLQDFDLGAEYTIQMVRAQIEATYDAGMNSWMLWNAANIYTRGALEEN